jgi:xanthine dehydrogenase small subunit
VRIPLPLATTTSFQKVAKRRYDDISSVAVASRSRSTRAGPSAPHRPRRGSPRCRCGRRADEDALTGRPWDLETVERAAQVLSARGSPIDDHRASAAYRVGDARPGAAQAARADDRAQVAA